MLHASTAQQLVAVLVELALLPLDLLELITWMEQLAEDLLEQIALQLPQQLPFALLANLDMHMHQTSALPVHLLVLHALHYQLLATLALELHHIHLPQTSAHLEQQLLIAKLI
jgi:hypothetical protein